MNDTTADIAASRYITSEVVGVFSDAAGLDATVASLAVAGIDRAALSVLGTGAAPKGRGRGILGTDLEPLGRSRDTAISVRVHRFAQRNAGCRGRRARMGALDQATPVPKARR
jgi:hypothetical protein